MPLKLTAADIAEAQFLRQRYNKTFEELSIIFGVTANTMRKYLRNYSRYGESWFTDHPVEVVS